MKRDIFRRGVRMQHHYGTLEQRNDPLGTETFEFNPPVRVDSLSKRAAMGPIEIRDKGEHLWREPRSAVVKPNGKAASFQGPAPDLAEEFARPIPVGTKRRLGPLRTDK
jgi:hypothetical protein